MYGTVAQFRARPGAGKQLEVYNSEQESVNIPGLVATYIYRLDTNPDEYYIAVIFDSKSARINKMTEVDLQKAG